MEFITARTCQYKSRIYRSGNVLNFGGNIVPCECGGKDKNCKICKGCGRIDPPHHFVKVDKEAELKKELEQERSVAEQTEALRSEFSKIGAAYDRRWGVAKLTAELTEARRERGL